MYISVAEVWFSSVRPHLSSHDLSDFAGELSEKSDCEVMSCQIKLFNSKVYEVVRTSTFLYSYNSEMLLTHPNVFSYGGPKLP